MDILHDSDHLILRNFRSHSKECWLKIKGRKKIRGYKKKGSLKIFKHSAKTDSSHLRQVKTPYTVFRKRTAL